MSINKGAVRCAWLCLLCTVIVPRIGVAGDPAPHRPPHLCAGIEIEAATDASVQTLYGRGYFVADESHLGGRYYVDPGHRVTLHVMIGTDHLIDGVEYQQGVHLPGKPTPQMLKAAETPRLTGNARIDGELSLGATPHAVRALYGKPRQDRSEGNVRTLVYTVIPPRAANRLAYDVDFAFGKGKLVSVLFDVSD